MQQSKTKYGWTKAKTERCIHDLKKTPKAITLLDILKALVCSLRLKSLFRLTLPKPYPNPTQALPKPYYFFTRPKVKSFEVMVNNLVLKRLPSW